MAEVMTPTLFDIGSASQPKWCFMCKEHKPSAMFGKNRAKEDGLQHYCKSCAKERNRKRDYQKMSTKTCQKIASMTPAERSHFYRQKMVRRKAKDPDDYKAYLRRKRLSGNFAMTEGEFDSMAAAQNGLCAICNRAKHLMVDHDHSVAPLDASSDC